MASCIGAGVIVVVVVGSVIAFVPGVEIVVGMSEIDVARSDGEAVDCVLVTSLSLVTTLH